MASVVLSSDNIITNRGLHVMRLNGFCSSGLQKNKKYMDDFFLKEGHKSTLVPRFIDTDQSQMSVRNLLLRVVCLARTQLCVRRADDDARMYDDFQTNKHLQ
jgi:hypothetical protein